MGVAKLLLLLPTQIAVPRAGLVLGLEDEVGEEPLEPAEPNELGPPLPRERTCPRIWFHVPTFVEAPKEDVDDSDDWQEDDEGLWLSEGGGR